MPSKRKRGNLIFERDADGIWRTETARLIRKAEWLTADIPAKSATAEAMAD